MQYIPHFISGLPRSGSTLVAALLHQKPALLCRHEQLLASAGDWRDLRGIAAKVIRLERQSLTERLAIGLIEPLN